MKAKYLWLALITLVFFGCDDSTGGLGMGMLPGSDGIEVGTKTFQVKTESSAFENYAVFAKTDIGYVGRFTDEEHGFGYYEGSFLTELNCIDSLRFPKPYGQDGNKGYAYNMAGDLDEAFIGAELTLSYYTFFGDSITPMQVSVYEIDDDKDLADNKEIHYTNINAENYISQKKLLGKKTFSAVNQEDSARHTKNYLHKVTIPIPDEWGKTIVKENWADTDFKYFKDSETFKELCKGVYITSEIGDGTVLYIQHLILSVNYNIHHLDSLGNKVVKQDGTDSIGTGSRGFASTMEVIQSNNIKVNEDIIKDKIEKDTKNTYIKSPAGIYTKAVLPVHNFLEDLDLDNDTINAVKLVLDAYHHDIVNEYSMSPPAAVLLVKDGEEAKTFFEKNSLHNNTTSYIARYSNNQYTFTNITRLITSFIKELKEAKQKVEQEGGTWDSTQQEDWLNKNATVAIIPVALGETTNSSTGAKTITHIQHDLKPTYVKLKGGKDGPTLDLQVTYSKFSK